MAAFIRSDQIPEGYIHLGDDVTVHGDDVIGIFDIERSTVSKSVNEFLKFAQEEDNVFYVSFDMPKSFIITYDAVYVSNVSVLTLRKRAKLYKENN